MFHVGQKVECVAPPEATEFRRDFSGAVVGQRYTVRQVVTCPLSHRVGLYLHEITLPIHPDHGIEAGFRAERFRPIVEKKTDAGMAILKEILERESFDERIRQPAR